MATEDISVVIFQPECKRINVSAKIIKTTSDLSGWILRRTTRLFSAVSLSIWSFSLSSMEYGFPFRTRRLVRIFAVVSSWSLLVVARERYQEMRAPRIVQTIPDRGLNYKCAAQKFCNIVRVIVTKKYLTLDFTVTLSMRSTQYCPSHNTDHSGRMETS